MHILFTQSKCCCNAKMIAPDISVIKKKMDSTLIHSQLTKWLNHKRRPATHLRRWAGRCSSAGGGPGTWAGPPRWRSSPPSADAPAPGSGSAQGPLTARQIATETEFTQENHLDSTTVFYPNLCLHKGPSNTQVSKRCHPDMFCVFTITAMWHPWCSHWTRLE